MHSSILFQLVLRFPAHVPTRKHLVVARHRLPMSLCMAPHAIYSPLSSSNRNETQILQQRYVITLSLLVPIRLLFQSRLFFLEIRVEEFRPSLCNLSPVVLQEDVLTIESGVHCSQVLMLSP